jgi:signal transduction histidine kinase
VLLARVRSGERRYVLRLTASLAQVDESVRTFHLVALTFVLGAGALLLVVQTFLGRRLSRRIGALKAHVQLLERGELDAQPEADASGDEVAALREVLARATAQLRRAREVQDRLLADAAHELRTPLTLMRTSLDLALRRERTPAELREALEDARAEVDRLARLATALLDMAAAGRGWDTAPTDLAALLDDAAEAARAEAERRGTWLEVDTPRPAVARVNATALRQAVDNLLSNALRFAPRGTPIRARLERHGETWRLSVRDEGPGIPEAQREAVFAPFHRVDRGGGSGLGLAIVSEVLRQHGGRAFAEAPTSGQGACVVLELPGAS